MRPTPHWARPETEYRLVRSGTPVTEDGFKLGAPTGEVVCAACGRGAMAVEAIQHAPDCENRPEAAGGSR